MTKHRGPRAIKDAIVLAVGRFWFWTVGAVIAGVVALLVSAPLVDWAKSSLSPDSDRHHSGEVETEETPAAGSVVDAQTGQVLAPQHMTRPTYMPPGAQIEGGPILWACNLTEDPKCHVPDDPKSPTYVRSGDRVMLVLRLHVPTQEGPLNFVKASIWVDESARTENAGAEIEWPTAESAEAPFVALWADRITITMTGPGQHRLEPVAGSSELLTPLGEVLARLPDGVISTPGILLRNVGPPYGCVDCDLDYVRYVTTTAVVE